MTTMQVLMQSSHSQVLRQNVMADTSRRTLLQPPTITGQQRLSRQRLTSAAPVTDVAGQSSRLIQSNPMRINGRAYSSLPVRIFYNITYKLKHPRFQLTRNENCKEHLDQASVCLDDLDDF